MTKLDGVLINPQAQEVLESPQAQGRQETWEELKPREQWCDRHKMTTAKKPKLSQEKSLKKKKKNLMQINLKWKEPQN